MIRRELLVAGAACFPGSVLAQVRHRPRLAMLSPQNAASFAEPLAALAGALRELGWVADRDYTLELHVSDGNYARLRELAQALATRPPEIVLTSNNSATAAAQRWMPSSTAILMIASLDPVAAGFVDSLARPGRNITGLAGSPPEAVGKLVEIAAQLAPSARRVLVLTQSSRDSLALADSARPAASKLRLEFVPVVADSIEDFAQRLPRGTDKSTQYVDVVVVPAMSVFMTFRDDLHRLLQERGLPAVYAWREHTLAGGAASYGPNRLGIYRQAARFVDRILRGAKPADLPVEQPMTYELILNRGSIRAQHLALPSALLLQATEVIE